MPRWPRRRARAARRRRDRRHHVRRAGPGRLRRRRRRRARAAGGRSPTAPAPRRGARPSAPRLWPGRAGRQGLVRDAAPGPRLRAVRRARADGAAARGRSLRAGVDRDARARARAARTGRRRIPRRRCARNSAPAPGSSPASPTGARFRWRWSTRATRRQAAPSRSATQRRRCIRWRGRDSTWDCATPSSWRAIILDTPREAIGEAPMLERYVARPACRSLAPASHSRTAW